MLDSYDIVTLVTNMEITFNFRIDGTDVVPENFGSVDSIAALLEKYGVH
jgi:acyl carrier protein